MIELSIEHFATLTGLTERHLYRLKREGELPFNEHNRIPLDKAGEWLRAYAVKRADVAGELGARKGAKLDRDREGARKDAALADKTELENAVRRGELIEAAEVMRGWQEILMRVKTRLMQIPSIVSPLVVGEHDQHTVSELIGDAVRDALTELSAPDDGADAP